jgi:hypothetical protein
MLNLSLVSLNQDAGFEWVANTRVKALFLICKGLPSTTSLSTIIPTIGQSKVDSIAEWSIFLWSGCIEAGHLRR